MNTDAFYSNTILKQDQRNCLDATQQHGLLAYLMMSRTYGSGQGEGIAFPAAGGNPVMIQAGWGPNLPKGKTFDSAVEDASGGSKVIFKFKNGYDGGSGGRNGTSITGFGNVDTALKEVAITPSTRYVKTSAIDEQFVNEMEGNRSHSYIAELDRKLRMLSELLMHMDSASLYTSGQYCQLTSVTSSGSTVIGSASIEYSIPVLNVKAVPVGTEIIFRASNGAAIADSVYGKVIDADRNNGSGNITVVFPDYASGFTVPSSALIVRVNSILTGTTANIGINGLEEMIGTGAHPRNEFNNTQLTAGFYKSKVITLATGVKPDYQTLLSLVQQVRESATTRGLGTDSTNSGFMSNFNLDGTPLPYSNRSFLLMNPRTRDRFNVAFYNDKASGAMAFSDWQSAKGFDEGLMFMQSFMNIPVVCDDLCPIDRIYYLNLGGIARIARKQYGPLPGDGTAEWKRVDGESVKYVLSRSVSDALLPLARDSQGSIKAFGTENFALDYTAAA